MYQLTQGGGVYYYNCKCCPSGTQTYVISSGSPIDINPPCPPCPNNPDDVCFLAGGWDGNPIVRQGFGPAEARNIVKARFKKHKTNPIEVELQTHYTQGIDLVDGNTLTGQMLSRTNLAAGATGAVTYAIYDNGPPVRYLALYEVSFPNKVPNETGVTPPPPTYVTHFGHEISRLPLGTNPVPSSEVEATPGDTGLDHYNLVLLHTDGCSYHVALKK
jgi:hypothetical protein